MVHFPNTVKSIVIKVLIQQYRISHLKSFTKKIISVWEISRVRNFPVGFFLVGTHYTRRRRHDIGVGYDDNEEKYDLMKLKYNGIIWSYENNKKIHAKNKNLTRKHCKLRFSYKNASDKLYFVDLIFLTIVESKRFFVVHIKKYFYNIKIYVSPEKLLFWDTSLEILPFLCTYTDRNTPNIHITVHEKQSSGKLNLPHHHQCSMTQLNI